MRVADLRKELRVLRAEAMKPVSKLGKRDVLAELDALRGPAEAVSAPVARKPVADAPKAIVKPKAPAKAAPAPAPTPASTPAPKLTRPAPGTPEMKAYMAALRARRTT